MPQLDAAEVWKEGVAAAYRSLNMAAVVASL
jgi:hypothetical protein